MKANNLTSMAFVVTAMTIAAFTVHGQVGSPQPQRFPDVVLRDPRLPVNPAVAAMAPFPVGTDLKKAVGGSDFVVDAIVRSVYPNTPLTADGTRGQKLRIGVINDGVVHITRYLKGCTPSPDVVVGLNAGAAFNNGERYIFFLSKDSRTTLGIGGHLPDRNSFPRYHLIPYYYAATGPADGPVSLPLLIRVDGTALRLNLRNSAAARNWIDYEGTDVDRFLSEIASYSKPPEKCAERQASDAAKKAAEERARAEKESRKKADQERKAQEEAAKRQAKSSRR
jgi:hypothetical protein